MKIKKISVFCLLVCFMLGTTGCGEAMIPLTDAEADTITLYATKMVSKFNTRQKKGLCNAFAREGELDFREGGTIPSPAPDDMLNNLDQLLNELTGNGQSSTPENNNQSDGGSTGSGGTTSAGSNTSGSDTSGLSLTQTLNVDGIDFYLDSFTVSEAFVSPDGAFALTARNGCHYLILDIIGKNNTSSPVTVDFLSRKSKYYVTLNNVYKQMSQTTILPNDISTYKGTIQAGKAESFTLIFQYSDTQLEAVKLINTPASEAASVYINFSVETDGNTRSTLF